MLVGIKKIMTLDNFSISKKIIEILLILLPIALLFSNILAETIIILLICFYFFQRNYKNFIFDINNSLIIFLIIFWIYLILNFVINFDNSPSLTRSIFFIRFPLLILSISFFINNLEINLKKVFFLWFLIILVTCIDLFFQYFNHVNLIGNEAILQGPIYRLGGFMGEELKISNFIFHFGTLTFIYFFSENFLKKNNIIFLYVLFLIFLIASIYITAERSNFIVAMSFFLIFNFFLLFKNRKILIFVGAIFSAMIILLSVSNEDLKERMIINNVFKEVKKLHYNPDKSYLNKDSVYFAHYSTAFQLFQKNILFGVGLKNYRKFCNNSEFNKNIHPAQHGRKCATHPHNFYFEFLSEVGLIGFMIIISFFIYSFYNFLTSKNNFIFLSSIILVVNFIPFLPRGSFFTNWNAIILWTVFAFIYSRCIKLENK